MAGNKERCVFGVIFLFFSVILLIFTLVKKQLPLVPLAVSVGLFGTFQELAQKPELAGFGDLFGILGEVCLFAVAVTVICFAAGRRRSDGSNG